MQEVNVLVNHSQFVNNTSNRGGGVIYAGEGVNLIISESRFINNSCIAGGVLYILVNVNTTMINSEFMNNIANHGGVLLVENTVNGNVTLLKMSNCYFVNNTAVGYGGGALAIDHSVNVTIAYSHFINNTALGYRSSGGVVRANDDVGIIITHSQFINNSATVIDREFNTTFGHVDRERYGGGVLYAVSDVNITIAYSCFIANRAASGDGGVVISVHLDTLDQYQETAFVIVMVHSQFDSNSALGNFGGGVIYAMSNVKKDIIITNSTFLNNHALSGGVMTAVGNCNITITKNSSFLSNAAMNGGVIVISGNVTSSLPSNQFINMNGSSEYNSITRNVYVHISQVNFINNRVLGNYGGGVILYANNFLDVFIACSQFTNNSASDSNGGVMWLEDSNVNVTSSNFDDNRANNGGIMYLRRVMVSINNSTIEHSMARKDGGVLYMDHSRARIDRTYFSHNTANCNGGIVYTNAARTVMNDCGFHDNIAGLDGGIITSHAGNITLYQSSYSNNRAGFDGGVISSHKGNITIRGCSFEFNSAGNDGGVVHMYQGTIDSSENTYQTNSAVNDGGVINAFQSTTRIMESSFTSNYAINDGGVVSAYQGMLSIYEGCSFSSNRAQNDGGVIHAFELYVTIKGNIYNNNRAENRGGVCFAYQGSLEVFQSIMSDSEATDGGVIYADQEKIKMANVSCLRNKAEQGGTLCTDHSTVSISCSSFSQSIADNIGGAWSLEGCQAMLEDVSFTKNCANSGGALYSSNSSMSLLGAEFQQNSANTTGGALYSSQSELKTLKTLLISVNEARLGAVYMVGSTAHLNGPTLVLENTGSFLMFNSIAIFTGKSKFNGCSEPISMTDPSVHDLREGGALTASKSDIIFNGTCILADSHAKNGGAIHATESKVYMNGDTTIANNTASDTGGGVYLYMSELHCQSNNSIKLLGNVAAKKGGGIHAISSSINVVAGNFTYNARNTDSVYFSSLLYLTNNEAERGGGLCLEMNTKLYILKSIPHDEPFPIVTFTGNSADYGGTIYVSDDSNLGMCNPSFSSLYKAKECFFQMLAIYSSIHSNYSQESMNISTQNVFFSQNYANISGPSLFGGQIGQCKLQHLSELQNSTSINVPQSGYGDKIVSGILYMTNISNINISEVSSKPVQLCFCKSNIPDCNYQPDPIRVIKGKRFTVEVVAVDQVNHLTSASVQSLLPQTGGGFGSGQVIQNVSETCTELGFNLFSPNDKEELIMYVEGPCKTSPLSHRRLLIQFTACDSCPIGFERHTDEDTSCHCVCDSRLKEYITKCNASTKLLEREGDFWITNVTSGYLVYDHCPLNYCKPSTTKVEINLNILDGADIQCANNHSGMLCGSCKSNFSLSLGSSRCIPCSTSWPTIFAILIATLVGGIALVTLLLVLNLTVAVGTLNGIILYANLVASSGSTFLPFTNPNFATVFISWLNLEIGFDICFFEGMDAYWKTLLQLAFPIYVIFLVIVIIFISECSTRFARLVAKRNPVATLATLLLLSYTKFLNTVIASLSNATLEYPDGSRRVVWLPDASVKYLVRKHIALFIMAILILLVGVIYTALLFSWQWLLRHQHKRIFKWTKHQKLCHFIEPYHAPYTFEQRYWTGLLLFVRVILYVIAAFNFNNDPQVSLVSTIIVVGLLPLLKCILERKIYKKRLVDVMEIIVYFNIIFFAAITLKTGTTKNQTIVAFTSVSITAALFLAIIGFHLFQYMGLLSLLKMGKVLVVRLVECRKRHHSGIVRIPVSDDVSPLITHSIVEIPTFHVEQEMKDVVKDTTRTSSITLPLIVEDINREIYH